MVPGSRLGTLQLGRYKGRLVNIFENLELGANTDTVAETVRRISKNCALEFQRTYDVGAISVVVAVPPVASLIFAIAWVRIYTHKGENLQTTVQTAFAVSSYIVTAGTDHHFYVPGRAPYFTLTTMRHRGFDTCSHRLFGPKKGPERRHDGENCSKVFRDPHRHHIPNGSAELFTMKVSLNVYQIGVLQLWTYTLVYPPFQPSYRVPPSIIYPLPSKPIPSPSARGTTHDPSLFKHSFVP